MISHLCFRKRVAPNGGKFKAPLHPFANYLCLAYFGLVLVLMTRIDDFRAGAIDLPIWLTVLGVAALIHGRISRRNAAQSGPATAAAVGA